ncbi:heavy metal translocating P-type ATPase [Brevibacillus sp. SYSU BS000544]|uniref:heavy metal translocating P-type ATPase n=1 Tax=Brevibacillus sp. SYSU BS000544 TaxID=3416443 RepID=UPI003CE5AD4C
MSNDQSHCSDSCCQDNASSTKTTNHPGYTSIPVTFIPAKESDCADSCCNDNHQPASDKDDSIAEGQPFQVYEIEGMDCGSCASGLEKHVSKSLGVQASVNFSTGKMKLAFEGDASQVIKVVEEAGYKAKSIQTNLGIPTVQSQEKTGWLSDVGVRNTIASGILLCAGFLISLLWDESTPVLFYAAAMFIAGYRLVKNAFHVLKSGALDMNVLMSAAAIGAAFLGEWLEGATVVFLFGLGNALQTISIAKTRKSIQSLMSLTPDEATVLIGSQLMKKPLHEVRVGEIVLIQPGERIPLDGTIIQGSSEVNQAPITGESLPVAKKTNDDLFAGTINLSGALEMRVTKWVGDTTLARIIHLVEEAQEKKAPTEQFVDRFAKIYTPIVFAIAFGIMIVPPLFTGNWFDWVYRGLELLVIACPCALVISTPVAVVSAIGSAAKNGILIKGGAALEVAGRITHIAFDKTGTLTEGNPSVAEVVSLQGDESTLLAIAKSIEERSKHPIAQAIVTYCNKHHIPSLHSSDHQAIVGKGAQATIDGTIYFVGNERLFDEIGLDLSFHSDKLTEWQTQGKTIVLAGNNQSILGMIAVSDTIRSTSQAALATLQQFGITPVMLTGDNYGSASHVANQLGIGQVHANLLPEQKLAEIESIKKTGTVAMIGDGINDAPALATAHIGIAMGGAGTDTAMETADVVLMADNLEKLPHVISLSQRALSIIKQNIWFSLIVKAIALLLIVPNWLTLWIAVLSDTGAALLVILNSMRLLRK